MFWTEKRQLTFYTIENDSYRFFIGLTELSRDLRTRQTAIIGAPRDCAHSFVLANIFELLLIVFFPSIGFFIIITDKLFPVVSST